MYTVELDGRQVPLVGADTETFPICKESIYPFVVCLSMATLDGSVERTEDYTTSLIGNNDLEALEQSVSQLFSEDVVSCWHNAAYDLTCLCCTFPDITPLVFKALDEGRVKDTLIREKLLNLADHGGITTKPGRGGGALPLLYGLDKILYSYTRTDISESKKGEDAWRTRYYELDGISADQYPAEASEYAIFDALYVFPVFEAQQKRAEELKKEGIDPFAAEDFRVKADFHLALINMAGQRVDAEKTREIRARMDKILHHDNFPLMIKEGVLRKPVPSKPYAKKTKNHQPDCPGHKEHPQYKKSVKVSDCDCPIKMKKGEPESINQKRLRELILELAEHDKRIVVKYTQPSSKFPDGQVCINDDWMEEYADFNPILKEYKTRAKEIKVVSSYLKGHLEDENGDPVDYIFGSYDVLKETGRTSSKTNDKYPSWNVQQVDPRVRPAIIPREGYYNLSCDYSSLELVTSSQVNIDRFGFSKQGEVINSGKDAHAYLATKMAYEMDADFKAAVDEQFQDISFDDLYEIFSSFEHSEVPERREFYEKYRKMAKPFGLGYPGGAGAKTTTEIARGSYGVDVTVETGKKVRVFWKQLYPDMKMHLDDINNNRRDPRNSPRVSIDKVTGERSEYDTYRYTSPLGMVRSGCTYTSCANGIALQTPGAEGALQGVMNVVRHCYDVTKNSILMGRFIPTAFIHDEVFGDIKICDEIIKVISQLEKDMVDGLDTVTPDVKASVETCLMKRWHKKAKPVFDEEGRLLPWEPKE